MAKYRVGDTLECTSWPGVYHTVGKKYTARKSKLKRHGSKLIVFDNFGLETSLGLFSNNFIKVGSNMTKRQRLKVATHSNDDGSMDIHIQAPESDSKSTNRLLTEAVENANELDLRAMIYNIPLSKLIRIAQLVHGRMYRVLRMREGGLWAK